MRTLFLLILFPLFIAAQNPRQIDSLKRVLASATDDMTRCSALSTLAYYLQRSDPEKAAAYNEEAMKLALRTGDHKLLADVWFDRAAISKYRGDYDLAIAAITTAGEQYLLIHDTVNQVECLCETGALYQQKNDPVKALVYYHQAEKILLASRKMKNLSKLYNGLGTFYLSQKEYEKSLDYYRKSLDINHQIDFPLGASVNLLNIGNVCIAQKDYACAIDNLMQSLKIKQEINDLQGIQKCYTNLGLVYANSNQPEKAIEFHNKTLEYARLNNNRVEMATALINLGFDYSLAGKHRQSIDFTNRGLKISDSLKILKFQTEAVRILAESYESLNDYANALRFHKMFKKYSDSLEREQNVKIIHEIQTKYEVTKKENEINILKINKNNQELELKNLQARNFLFIGLILLVSFGLVFFFYRSRINKKISRKLHEINEMKSRFFSNLSHEFRTPLTLMIGPAEKLLERAGEAERPWLELIHRNASRLLFLDEQLLEFTRIDSGAQKLKLVSGDIVLAARIIGQNFESFATRRNIFYEQSYPGEPITALFDPDILEKTLGNLLTNAFKYTPEGNSVHFEVSREMKEGQSMISFIVNDTGPGIPDDKKEQIFERFYQLNRNAGTSFGGAGIGLALTRELIELHHGSCFVESREGVGSKFTLMLPESKDVYSPSELESMTPWSGHHYKPLPPSAETGPEVDSGEAHPPILSIDPESSKNLQILIVEDNKDMRQYIRYILMDHYQVSEAVDGASGLKEAIRLKPGLIITDIMMEGMDGLELCNQLRENNQVSHIPVIMLTALHTSADRIRGLETGADDYLTKPFNEQELLARIRNLITRREALRSLFTQEFRMEPSAPAVTSADARFIQKLIEIVENNIDNPEFDVTMLSESIGLSRSQLHRRLSVVTGQSATGFIRVIRMKRAAQLLKQKAGNISEVMYLVGFDNLSYFSKCFREVYNVTPKEYISASEEPQNPGSGTEDISIKE